MTFCGHGKSSPIVVSDKTRVDELAFSSKNLRELSFHRHRPAYSALAVSTRPPAGDLSRCALSCLGPAYFTSAVYIHVRRIYRASRSNSLGPCGPL